MNPSPEELAASRSEHERERRSEALRQSRLHRAALVRRKKRKRGGPK